MVPLEKAEISKDKEHIKAHLLIAGDRAGKAIPRYVEKTWGHELIYYNDGDYCMKVLQMDGGATSTHFHVSKHETLLVVSGTLTLETIVNKVVTRRKLEKGVAWVICPGYVHKLIAEDGPVTLVEASTYDHEDDSIRIS